MDNSDRMGFTLHSNVGIISFEYNPERGTLMRNVPALDNGRDEFPEVGNLYQFDSISLPTVWSIGVVIKRGNVSNKRSLSVYNIFVTDYIRSLREGTVFRRVCPSVHRVEG